MEVIDAQLAASGPNCGKSNNILSQMTLKLAPFGTDTREVLALSGGVTESAVAAGADDRGVG
jgi:hypothetical protein